MPATTIRNVTNPTQLTSLAVLVLLRGRMSTWVFLPG